MNLEDNVVTASDLDREQPMHEDAKLEDIYPKL